MKQPRSANTAAELRYSRRVLREYGADLASYWSLDEYPGASSFTDLVGGHHAGINGGWALGQTPLVYGSGASANGDGSTSYADAGDVDILDIGNDEPFTVSAWIDPDDVTDFHFIFAKRDGNHGWSLYHDDSLWFFQGDGTNNQGVARGTIDTSRQHVACIGRNNGRIDFYIDGLKVGEKDYSPIDDLSNNYPARIGTRVDNDLHVSGRISNLWFCDTDLSDTDIARIYKWGRIK